MKNKEFGESYKSAFMIVPQKEACSWNNREFRQGCWDNKKRVSWTRQVTLGGWYLSPYRRWWCGGQGHRDPFAPATAGCDTGLCSGWSRCTFLCRNGDVNSALLVVDGLHLSEAGSKALTHNFNLASKAHVHRVGGYTTEGRSGPPAPHTMYLSSMALVVLTIGPHLPELLTVTVATTQKCLGPWPLPSPTQRRSATNVSLSAPTAWARHRREGKHQQGHRTSRGRAWCIQIVHE